LSREQLIRLAKLGAAVRLAAIKQERDALSAMIRDERRAAAASRISTDESAPATRRHRRRAWSAAQRRAVSARMKRYWAVRRKAKKR